MQHRPEVIARYTVEQNGGEYSTEVLDLLSLFGRQKLTELARREIGDALLREGVATEPELDEVRRSDSVRLFLLESQQAPRRATSLAPRGQRHVPPLVGRLRPRTWKGWLAYGLAALFIVGLLAGGSEDPEEAAPVAQEIGASPDRREASVSRSDRRERLALRKERQRLHEEQAELRRERATARERARVRKARAAAERERERREQLEAQQAAPPPEPVSNCHPSYEPCLDPNASDYDCEGGSGDGPMYTGFVTVKGSDDYGLDSDGDGTGCDS